jgi:hypothetical protein
MRFNLDNLGNTRYGERDGDDDVWAEPDRDTKPPPTYPTDFYRRSERRAEMSE